MKSLIATALLAGLAGPALAWDAGAEPQPERRFLAACAAEGGRFSLCLCVLDRLVASIAEPPTLDEALAGGLARLVRHSDPRVSEALLSGAADCGARLALRPARGG
jgi:hypothetical protein